MTDKFNYGRIFNFYSQNIERWIKGSGGIEYKVGVGTCYCLSTAVWKLYPANDTTEIRKKLLDKIKELYPSRTSSFATKLAREKEPLIAEQYSLVSFNDHPQTNIVDILLICKEAQV
jgi:hypothetical protein